MALVLDLDHHVVGGNERLLVEGGAFGGGHVARAQRDLAAVLHRVARVDDEIDDHLLELVEVGLDQPQVAPEHDVEFDRLADQPAQQHLQVGQHFAELQRLRPQRLAAREGEQLPHQAGGPVGVLLDLHDVLEGRIGRAVVGEQQVGIADDRGQDVVEVVGDAAGELADRLHLLALDETLLQRPLFGGVEGEDGRVRAFVALGIGGGRDEEPRRARRLAGEREIDRGDVAPAGARRGERFPERGVVAFGHAARRATAAIRPPDGFSAAGASRAKAPLARSTPPSAATEAIAIGVELKKRAKRTSAARRSSPASSPGAWLSASVRDGPGRPALEKATRCSSLTGRNWPPRRLRSTSKRSVVTSPGRPETTLSSAAPSPATMSASLSCPAANWAMS